MHVLPDLDFVEKKYKEKPFTVVGVHSAKFDNEKDLEAIRNAVLRYNITHPVVNDGDMYLWRELGVNSWPTFVLIGPNGKVLAQISGEGHRKDLDEVIGAALEFYEEKKLLQNDPLPLALEKDKDSRLLTSPLKFPGKLAVDVQNNRLFISDSNHNRIVVTNLEGQFIYQVGSSEEGLLDGPFDAALFNRPQGIAYNSKRNILYVADTENHALREINFVDETVRTLAGNGTKGSDYRGGGQGTNQVLNSPWDVCYDPAEEAVYIAMAGQHQIWKHNLHDGITKVISGDGYERNLNGSR
ncbi:Chloroplast protein HCF243 [Zea mays]|uniref:Chloroplast protein HCF243 n=1 Tax=Zea mays TaxID=4577 RepID=A0A1D6K0S0_MAIZE|nr:Chloroplast protein HCF243 [Zea mays]